MRNVCRSISPVVFPRILANIIPAALCLTTVIILSTFSLVNAAGSYAWQDEFDEICMMVQVGDTLTRKELRDLIERVDSLAPKIQSSDHPSKKVFMFRLKKCRSFFEYIIELKESESAQP